MISKIDLNNIENNTEPIRQKLKFFFESNIKNFSDLISNSDLNKNIDWCLSLPYSRNTLVSKFYEKFCTLLFIQSILKENDSINEIIVETDTEKKIIETYITNSLFIHVVNKTKKFTNFKNAITLFIFFLNQLVSRSLQLFFCRLTKIFEKSRIVDNIILIDVYAIPNFYTKDRYFVNLLDFVDNEDEIFFLPTIAYTKISDFFKVYKEFRKSKNNYLLKEDFVSFFDVIKSIFFIYRVRKLSIKNFKFNEIDFSNIIKDEINSLNGDNIAIEGWVNYYFFKRLKNTNIKIQKLIDWWENQSTDKGMNLGIKKYFPITPTLGYLGYVPRYLELQVLPTKTECEYNMIPDEISVIGKAIINKLKYLNSELKVITAPAFRYNYLWDIDKKFNKNLVNILIALPILLEDTVEIVNKVKNLENYISLEKYNFLIKLHPTMDDNIFFDKVNLSLNKNFILTNKNIKVLLEHVDLVISSKSIVCLEAVSLGIPTLVFEKQNIINFNPIPKEIDKQLYKNFFTTKDLYKYLIYFESRDYDKNLLDIQNANKIRSEFFEKIDKEKVQIFIK